MFIYNYLTKIIFENYIFHFIPFQLQNNDYINWATGSPSDPNGDQSCVKVDKTIGFVTQWKNAGCDADTLADIAYPICQINACS